MQGPNDAGDVSIDEAGFQLACGGHVTPPTENIQGPPGAPPGSPPLYHYHKSPECLAPFLNASIGFDHGAQPYSHGQGRSSLSLANVLPGKYPFPLSRSSGRRRSSKAQ